MIQDGKFKAVDGSINLGFNGNRMTIQLNEFPKEIRDKLTATEIEDLLCVFKNEFET